MEYHNKPGSRLLQQTKDAADQPDNDTRLHMKTAALGTELLRARDGQKSQQQLCLRMLDILASQAESRSACSSETHRSSREADSRLADLEVSNTNLERRCAAAETQIVVLQARLNDFLDFSRGPKSESPWQDLIAETHPPTTILKKACKSHGTPDLLIFNGELEEAVENDSISTSQGPRDVTRSVDDDFEGHKRAVRHFVHRNTHAEVGEETPRERDSTEFTASSMSLQRKLIPKLQEEHCEETEDQSRRQSVASTRTDGHDEQANESAHPCVSDDVNFGQFGIEYKPLVYRYDAFRTVLLEGLPGKTMAKDVLELIHGGVIVSVHVANTPNMTDRMSAIVVFACCEGARQYVDYCAAKPPQLGDSICDVSLLPSETFPSSPQQQMKIVQGYTRCIVACNIPNHLTLERVIQELKYASYPFDSGIVGETLHGPRHLNPSGLANVVYEYYQETNTSSAPEQDDDYTGTHADRFIHIPFISIDAAEAAADKLLELSVFGDCSVMPARDPCDRFLGCSPSPSSRAYPHRYYAYRDNDEARLSDSPNLDYGEAAGCAVGEVRNPYEAVRNHQPGKAIVLDKPDAYQSLSLSDPSPRQSGVEEDRDRPDAPDAMLCALNYGIKGTGRYANHTRGFKQTRPASNESCISSSEQDAVDSHEVPKFPQSSSSDNSSRKGTSPELVVGGSPDPNPLRELSSGLYNRRKITRYSDSDDEEDNSEVLIASPPAFSAFPTLNHVSKKANAAYKSRGSVHNMRKLMRDTGERDRHAHGKIESSTGSMQAEDGNSMEPRECSRSSYASADSQSDMRGDGEAEQSLEDERTGYPGIADDVELDY